MNGCEMRVSGWRPRPGSDSLYSRHINTHTHTHTHTHSNESVKYKEERKGSECVMCDNQVPFRRVNYLDHSWCTSIFTKQEVPCVSCLSFQLCLCICCCCSVAQSRLTPCDPMDCSKPGFPVHHQLPEFAQTHVHWVSDTIQPCHPLSSPFPPALNLAQY